MEVKAWLEEIRTADAHIKNLIDERDKIRLMMITISSPMGHTDGGGRAAPTSDSILNAVIRLNEHEEKLDAAIDDYINLIRHKRQVVDRITNPFYLRFISSRFFDFRGMQQIADDMNYTLSGLNKLQKRALWILQKLIDEGDKQNET